MEILAWWTNDAGTQKDKKKNILFHAYLYMFDNLDDVIQALAAANMSIANISSCIENSAARFVPKFTFAPGFILYTFLFCRMAFSLSLYLSFPFFVTLFSHSCVSLLIFRVHSRALIFIVMRSSMEFVKYLLCCWFCCASCVSVAVFFFFVSPIQFIYIWVSFHFILSFFLCCCCFFLLLEKWISSVMCMKVRERRNLNDILIARTWATNEQRCSN